MADCHLGTLHVRFLVGVVGIFVTHIDKQFTGVDRNRLNDERQRHALTVLAVDSDGTTLRYVQLHVVGWRESQHDLGCVVRSQRIHLLTGGSHHPAAFRQSKGNLTRLAQTNVGDVEHVVTALAFRHRGFDAADACTNLASCYTVVVVDHAIEGCSLVACELHLEILPAVTAARYPTRQLEGKVGLAFTVERGDRCLLQFYLIAHRNDFHANIVQWQCTRVADAYLCLVRNAHRRLILQETAACQLHAIHVEAVLCHRQVLANITCTHIVVSCHAARIVSCREIACCVGCHCHDLANAAVQEVNLHVAVADVRSTGLTREGDVLVGGKYILRHRHCCCEASYKSDGRVRRSVVDIHQFLHLLVLIHNSLQLILSCEVRHLHLCRDGAALACRDVVLRVECGEEG